MFINVFVLVIFMCWFSNRLKDYLSEKEEFQEASEIVCANGRGNIWLIGGSVYRSLAHLLYDVEEPDVDFDFIVEGMNGELILPCGWDLKTNSYGNPKFVSNGSSIDFVLLDTVESIKRRGLDFTFDNFLTGTPLTIQSIGYNVLTGKIEGEIGIYAIRNRIVGINDLTQTIICSRKQRLSVENFVKIKARSLDFDSALEFEMV